jgi:hypothetical protein
MRRRTIITTASIVMKLASNAVMGVAMGLLFVLVLNILDQSGVVRLIDHSSDQGTTVLVFVGIIVMTFGIGATLTGIILIMMDES